MTPTLSPEPYHRYDSKTLICECGETKEEHLNIDLKNEKWKMLNFQGKVNIKKMLKDLCNS